MIPFKDSAVYGLTLGKRPTVFTRNILAERVLCAGAQTPGSRRLRRTYKARVSARARHIYSGRHGAT